MKKTLLTLALMVGVFAMAQEQKVLVAYFSATGTTKAVAEQLAQEENAFLWEIEPVVEYLKKQYPTLSWQEGTLMNKKDE